MRIHYDMRKMLGCLDLAQLLKEMSVFITAAAEAFAKAKNLVQPKAVKKKQFPLTAKPSNIKVRKVFSVKDDLVSKELHNIHLITILGLGLKDRERDKNYRVGNLLKTAFKLKWAVHQLIKSLRP